MEPELTYEYNSFDPTPRLKSSHAPILFIPFNYKENRCNYCGNKYSLTVIQQKYCKNCLSWYIKYTGNNEYLDVHINTNSNQCISHHISNRNINFCTRNVQEWCRNCSEVSYFKQIIPSKLSHDSKFKLDTDSYVHDVQNKIIETCKFCEKSNFHVNYHLAKKVVEFRLCLCYRISSGWINSTLNKKNPIPILYLPWWDTHDNCVNCNLELIFISDCQKWCLHCFVIYTGCRYCLTTNIIFGITNRSQCIKCKRELIITIDMANISSENNDIDEFLDSTRTTSIDINNINHQIANYMNNLSEISNPLDMHGFINDSIDELLFSTRTNVDIININNQIAKVSNNIPGPLDVYGFIKDRLGDIHSKPFMKWIPYSQITFLEKLAEGGFGIIYKATMFTNKIIAVKRFFNSRDTNNYVLNELKSLHQCYNPAFVVKCYGITRDLVTKEYMLIMEYASGGNLHDYLQKNFVNITWNKKLYILWKISEGLKAIHKKDFVHRDFHSKNILLTSYQTWLIGDLGLSHPEGSVSKEIYGVIPYVAPEIFKRDGFTKKSDIYSMGMIMWELTTGCKPFSNVKHNLDLVRDIINGKRPEITNDTPDCFVNLMKNCWDTDPLKRPCITKINEIVGDWYFKYKYNNQFKQAEIQRLKLV